MQERKIDQEVDFKIIRGDRPETGEKAEKPADQIKRGVRELAAGLHARLTRACCCAQYLASFDTPDARSHVVSLPPIVPASPCAHAPSAVTRVARPAARQLHAR